MEVILLNFKNTKTISILQKIEKISYSRKNKLHDEDNLPPQKRVKFFQAEPNLFHYEGNTRLVFENINNNANNANNNNNNNNNNANNNNNNNNNANNNINNIINANPNGIPNTTYSEDIYNKFSEIINNQHAAILDFNFPTLPQANLSTNFIIKEVYSKDENFKISKWYSEMYGRDFLGGDEVIGGVVRKRTLFLFSKINDNDQYSLIAVAKLTEYDERSFLITEKTKSIYLDYFDTVNFFQQNLNLVAEQKRKIKQAFLSSIIGNSQKRGFETFRFWASAPQTGQQKYIFNRPQTATSGSYLRSFYNNVIEMSEKLNFIIDRTKGIHLMGHSNWFYGKNPSSYKEYPYQEGDPKLYNSLTGNRAMRKAVGTYMNPANNLSTEADRIQFNQLQIPEKTLVFQQMLLENDIAEYENSSGNNVFVLFLQPPTPSPLARTRNQNRSFYQQVRILDNPTDGYNLSPFRKGESGALLNFQKANHLIWTTENEAISSTSYLVRFILLAHRNDPQRK